MKNTQDRNDKMFDIILEEAFEKYAHDVASEELEYELSDEEMAEMESKKQEIYNNIMEDVNKKAKKKFPVKRIVVLAAVLIIVLAMGFSSFSVGAFRTFIYKTLTDVKGTILNINSERVVEESYNNIRNFEYSSEFIVPGWLPPELTLDNVLDDTSCVELYYNDDDTWLTIKEEFFSGQIKTRVVAEYNVMDMKCSVVEIVNERNIKTYAAYFCSDRIYYTLFTNGSRTMLETVLGNLKYFEE